MFKKIFIGLLLVIGIFALIVHFQPADFRISRSATIAAPPEVVFAQVNDFHKWEAWSPWAKMDPKAKNSFEGPTNGKGAHFKWEGDSNVGQGSMTIIDSQPNDLIRIKLDFIKPFEATNNTEFSFKPQGDQTVVTWTMSGVNNFMSKAFCLVMNQEKMVGGEFEKGLANIKSIAEAQAKGAQ